VPPVPDAPNNPLDKSAEKSAKEDDHNNHKQGDYDAAADFENPHVPRPGPQVAE
jgi:hypothetical protein